jgi:beta-lactam-binding protein with PASTA domain
MAWRSPFKWFKPGSLGSVLVHLTVVAGTLLLLGLFFFYVYLPTSTNHGETVTVPDLTGMDMVQVEEFLAERELRFEVSDSSYTKEFQPLSVLKQYPSPGSLVKENRKIYLTINRVTPPTVPVPELVDRSLLNAEVVLRSNELVRGRIFLIPDPFLNLVKEMRYEGRAINAGTRVPKGAVIDLVVTNGLGKSDFIMYSLMGTSYTEALFKIEGWNLHLGTVEIAPGSDTTGVVSFVYKQRPEAGDSVRIGDPVDLWIGPKGYKEPDAEVPEGEENE